MRSRVLLLLLLAVAPALAEEDRTPTRDPAAVAKVEAAEKLAYLPRREALTKLKVVATLIQPGKHAVFDRKLSAFEVWLEEPEYERLTAHGSGDREAEKILRHHDGKRCVRRDLVDFAVWPFALYPHSDLMDIEFAPKSRTRVRIFDRQGTGVEVTFGRNGLPKQHTYYERGKRERFDRLEYSEYGGVWLLDRRTAQGGKDETTWHWEHREGLWLPKSIDRTLGKARFRIDLDYRTIEKRPEGTPPKLPPRSDPAAVAALARADRLMYDPVARGVTEARFKVRVSKPEWKDDRAFLASFTAPDRVAVFCKNLAAEKDPAPKTLIEICLLRMIYVRPPFDWRKLPDPLVTRKPEAERTFIVSDRKSTEFEVRLDKNGAVASLLKRVVDRVMFDQRYTHRFVEGSFLIEESRSESLKSTFSWTWEKLDGIWLPKRVVHRAGGDATAFTASGYEITKKPPKAE